MTLAADLDNLLIMNYSYWRPDVLKDQEKLAFSLPAKIKHTERDFKRKIGHFTLKGKSGPGDGTFIEYQEKFCKIFRHTNPKGKTFLFGKFYKGRSDSLMITLAYLNDNCWYPCQN